MCPMTTVWTWSPMCVECCRWGGGNEYGLGSKVGTDSMRLSGSPVSRRHVSGVRQRSASHLHPVSVDWRYALDNGLHP
jgi:hypothetical protein